MKNFGKNLARRLEQLLCSIVLTALSSTILYADAALTEPATVPLSYKKASWVFSGAVMTESGESYDYFFQVKRLDNTVQAMVFLLDTQSKALVFKEEAETQLSAESAVDNWTIGPMFVRYNTINNSWIIGLDKGNQLGFNFKVDTLNQVGNDPVLQRLRQGVQVMVVQTGQVNGLIQREKDTAAQFVTAKHAWFREVILTESPVQTSQLQGLLCGFEDGSGLYAMQLNSADVVRGSFSGLYDTKGLAQAVSQFIHVEHTNPGSWRVRVPYPKLEFELADTVEQHAVVLGFLANKDKQGFCVVSQE